jgi:ribosomal protein L16 Arg81 hydroxylase
MVLVDSLVGSYDWESKKVATDRLLDHAQIDTAIVSEPTTAYRTTLEAGDVLYFDHSQPHAFVSLTEDRASRAHYLVNK